LNGGGEGERLETICGVRKGRGTGDTRKLVRINQGGGSAPQAGKKRSGSLRLKERGNRKKRGEEGSPAREGKVEEKSRARQGVFNFGSNRKVDRGGHFTRAVLI